MQSKLRTFLRRGDRRDNRPVSFPLVTASGDVVAADRRQRPCRRQLRLTSLVPLFKGLDEQTLIEALADCCAKPFHERTTLLRPGEVNHHIYILLSGTMTVTLGLPDSPHVIDLQPGQSVGEMSIADAGPVSAEVVAEADSLVLVIDEETFWEKVVTMPGVARNLIGTQAERLRRNNDQLIEKLRKESQLELLQRDLSVAAEIQLGMLPREFPLYPNCPQFDVHATMLPAREVGGDFYDAFLVDQDRLFFIIGDVSGKGVAAALFMARAMTLFRTEASRNLSPHETLRRVNDQLSRNNDSCMFVSVVCGVMNIQTGEVQYANGGHNPPLLGNAAGFSVIKVPEGPLIGIFENSVFASAQMRLWPGEMLLLYTDGVSEAVNRRGEQFSVERLVATLSVAGAANASQTVKRLCEALDSFTEGEAQFDDITVLAIKYRSEATVAVPWQDSWGTGIFQIDQQHHRLLNMLNQLDDLVQAGAASEDLVAAGAGFIESCREHFFTEDSHMKQIRYPLTEQHNMAHASLAAALTSLVDRLAGPAGADRHSIVGELKDLWIRHIETEDARMARHPH